MDDPQMGDSASGRGRSGQPPAPSDEPIASASAAELAEALAALIAKGLPLKEADAGRLVELRSAYARAVVPSDVGSRLQALNELLPRLIARLDDAVFREAVQMLFGLAPGTRGTGLMVRRRQAADHLGYSVGHFRERKEQDLLEAVAILIHDDLLRYQSRVKRAAEALEPTGDTPRLGPEHLTHEEELVSRIWSRVYGLRAEVIAHARLSCVEGFESQAEDHRQAAIREEEALSGLLNEYVDTYGDQLVKHGDAELSVEALRRVAGWRA